MLNLFWPYDLIWTLVFGLCLGSFTTAVIYRELKGESWSFPKPVKQKGNVCGQETYRSTCPQCKHILSVLDLFPVFSWLFLHGRCRYCNKPIGSFYPLIEILVLIACGIIFYFKGMTLLSLIMMAAVPFLIALIVIDLKLMILPNSLILSLSLLGVLAAFFTGTDGGFHFNLKDGALSVLAGVVYALFILSIAWLVSKALRKDALGGGDVKFFFVAGLWLGGGVLPLYCILSGVIGIVLGIVWKALKKGDVFPFGPALIISLMILWLFEGSFLQEIM